MRARKALSNTSLGILYEIVAVICGLILPRLILISFGSAYNGMTSAIVQFLSAIALLQAGIGGVTMAALYKPLAEKNIETISIIVKTTEVFMRKVALIFIFFSIAVACLYPLLIQNNFDWFFTFTLVLIMSCSKFMQYFFGVAYVFLVNADQRQSFIYVVDIIKIIANTLVAVVLIKAGFGIHAVMVGSAIIFLIAPLYIRFHTRNKYNINSSVQTDNKFIKQRWDNFAQEMATFININMGLIILSFFSNIYEISVYAVYRLVTNGVQGLLLPFVRGMAAAFGNMFANEEYDLIERNLRLIEEMIYAISSFMLGVTAAMIVPFIMVYTKGVTDVDYERYIFAQILVAASLFQCYRRPYQVVTQAVGHFKQLRNSAFTEAIINIVISLITVIHLGIIGVALGSCCAYFYRTVRYSLYVSKNIVKRSFLIFLKRMSLSLLSVIMIASIPTLMQFSQPQDFLQWIQQAVIVSAIGLLIIFIIEFAFYKDDLNMLIRIIHKNFKQRKGLVMK